VGHATTRTIMLHVILRYNEKGGIFYKDMVKLRGSNTLIWFHQYAMLQEWPTNFF
jgi:hypothetical protein